MARGLNDIADALRRGQTYGRGCTLLIGAGCSKTAKIPLAGEIVDHIRNSRLYDRVYQLALERAKSLHPDAVVPTYGQCMEEMYRGDQRDLLRGYIKNARLNWAHAGIASLVKHGYVDRITPPRSQSNPAITRCSPTGAMPSMRRPSAARTKMPTGSGRRPARNLPPRSRSNQTITMRSTVGALPSLRKRSDDAQRHRLFDEAYGK